MSIDIDRIVNGTPSKRIINAYNTLKENYTEENALKYKEVYTNESISDILDNAEIIFSEPYYGTQVFISMLDSNSCIWFSRMEEIYDKVCGYIEKYSNQMDNKDQLDSINLLKGLLFKTISKSYSTINYAYYIRDNIGDIEKVMLKEFDKDSNHGIIENTMMENDNNPVVLLTYLPYVAEFITPEMLDTIANHLLEICDIREEFDNDRWSTYVESIILCNKLSKDKFWFEKIADIPSRIFKSLIRELMNTNLNEVISSMNIKRVKSIPHHVSIESAIDDQLLNMEFGNLNEDDNRTTRDGFEDYKNIAFEKTKDHIAIEYSYSNNIDLDIDGFTLFKEDCSLSDAYQYLSLITEEENTDYEVNNKDSREYITSTTKAPKAKNIASKVQFGAMDAEAKQMALFGKISHKGQEIVNAGKAVAAIPMNVAKEIKKVAADLDKADVEKRKAFMTDPGFRKKSFHNLTTAIKYGVAAQVNLALVPVLMIVNHFRKDENIKIRNELIREIETEIKVCEEKINDASSDGDKQEKYRLIRIREKLNTELVRVKTNSKYV